MSDQQSEKAGRGRRRWARGALSIALGLLVGLVAAELAFSYRDQGAFPHLNIYDPDPTLGVRLRPGATERVAFGGNPVTSVRINAEGFRGPAWPPPADNEILVVGDSQVFGLGVEEGETFSAELERIFARNGKPRAVLNAGVPTYGPPEYRAVIEEQLRKRKIGAVIYVVNLVNDLFEASRPNTDRHRVWDGWAVRAETAPDHITQFPGRAWLYGRSHLVYAIRQFLYRRDLGGDAPSSLASEGTWTDILGAAATAEESRAGAERETARLLGERRSGLKKAADEVLAAQLELEDKAYGNYPELEQTEAGIAYRKSHGYPGDIVIVESTGGVESERPFTITAQYILKGAEVRARVEKLIRDLAEIESARPEWQTVLRSFEERAERQKRLAELHAAPLEIARSWSPLAPALKEVKALCDARGARLLVVALPMDVQVSKDEWKKYQGATAIDMGPSSILMSDLVSSAEAIGAMGLDATPALASAEPGAFLNADIHMTPKGHKALAEAIAKKIDEPLPAPLPAPGLPLGRSLVPDASEWANAKNLTVRGAPNCIGRMVREWALVTCARWLSLNSKKGASKATTVVPVDDETDEPTARSVSVIEGGHGEALAYARGRALRVLAPILPDEALAAELSWVDSTQTLRARRSKDGLDLDLWMEGAVARPDADAAASIKAGADVDKRVAALCSCHKEVTGSANCSDLVAAPDSDCERTYPGDCKRLLECSSGSPVSPPRCLSGWVNAGALGHCYKTCAARGEACAAGSCTAWQGVSVCM